MTSWTNRLNPRPGKLANLFVQNAADRKDLGRAGGERRSKKGHEVLVYALVVAVRA